MFRYCGIALLHTSFILQFVPSDDLFVPNKTNILFCVCFYIGIVFLLLYRLIEFAPRKYEKFEEYDEFTESIGFKYVIIVTAIFILALIGYSLPKLSSEIFFGLAFFLHSFFIIILLIMHGKKKFEKREKNKSIKKYQKTILNIFFTAPVAPMFLYCCQLVVYGIINSYKMPNITNIIDNYILKFYYEHRIIYDYQSIFNENAAYRQLFYDFAHIYVIFTAAGLAYLAYIFLINRFRRKRSDADAGVSPDL